MSGRDFGFGGDAQQWGYWRYAGIPAQGALSLQRRLLEANFPQFLQGPRSVGTADFARQVQDSQEPLWKRQFDQAETVIDLQRQVLEQVRRFRDALAVEVV